MTRVHPATGATFAEVTTPELQSVSGGFVKAYFEPGYAIRDDKGVGVTITEDGIFWKNSAGKTGVHWY